MRDLSELREEIDLVDSQIVDLFEKRMDLSTEVAEYKIKNGKEVFDKNREEEKLKSLKDLARNDFNGKSVVELFTQIMGISRKLQYGILAERGLVDEVPFKAVEELNKENVRVIFQGTNGAYSQQAMIKYFGPSVDSFNVQTFRDAMIALKEKKADYAVLPIENSSAGIVNDMYDLLVEFDNYILAETFIKVEHALLVLEGTRIEDIKRVYSHPQALMQCSKFLEKHKDWQVISQQNTAVSAVKVTNEKDKSQAAIASELAGELYGLKALEHNIQNNNENTTRFIIISDKKIFKRNSNKISIYFELPHSSGTLYNMLSHFIYNNLNMTKVESRPIEGRNWEYRFFVDFEGNLSDSGVKNALRGIRTEAKDFKILGNY